MSERIRIAIDLAKSVFQLAVSDRPGKVTRKARLNRAQLLPFLAQQPPAIVFMEACGSAHYWARKIRTANSSSGRRVPSRMSNPKT